MFGWFHPAAYEQSGNSTELLEKKFNIMYNEKEANFIPCVKIFGA
jgi:hypothetical protein